MQQRIDAITAHTVPSTYVRTGCRPTKVPYRRVVGLVVPGFGEQWSRIDPTIPEAAYSRDEAASEEFEMPGDASNKLGRFWMRFFVEPPRVRSEYLVDRQEEYTNCHRFGYWMRGVHVAEEFDLPDEPNHIVDMGRSGHPLRAGVHGVLGQRDDAKGIGVARHSVVGLGEDRNDCIQVLASGGFMGIDTYRNAIDYYESPLATGSQVIKIYY